MALDRLKSTGGHFSNILDLGTGTGLLAFAELRLWPTARMAASDIDPVSIEVTEETAGINNITIGRARGKVALAVARSEERRVGKRGVSPGNSWGETAH